MKRLRMVIISIILTAVLSACGGNNSEQRASNTPPPKESQNTQVAEKPSNTPIPEETKPPFDWTTAELTEDSIKQALSSGIPAAVAITVKDETLRKIAITEDTKGAYIELTVNPGVFGNEKDFVKKSGGSLVAYSKILFENPYVYEVSVQTLINATGGGENNAVYISWRREQTEGVDLNEVLDSVMADYTIPFTLARKYSIQTAIYDKLNNFDQPRQNNM